MKWKSDRSGQKKPPNTKRPILRPIICICNDHNASSLVKLRQHALQIRFTRPADVHSVKRLKEICELEDLNADFRALGTLVAVARGDLRGCLNALQVSKPLVIPLVNHLSTQLVHQITQRGGH